MHVQTFLLLTGIIVSVLNPALLYSQNNSLSVDKDHVAGMVEAHLASLEGWRTGDLLIRIDEVGNGRHFRMEEQDRDGVDFKFVEGPDARNVVTQRNTLIRFIFDFDKRRVLIVNHIEYEDRVFDGLDKQVGLPEKQMINHALLYDEVLGVSLARLEAGVIHRLESQTDMETLIASWRVPNVRGFGCTSIGLTPWDSQRLTKQVELLGNVDTIEEIENISKDRYRVRSRFGGNLSIPGRIEVDWNARHNFPVKVTSYFSNRENVPYNYTSTVDWKSIDRHFVPILARGIKNTIPEYQDRKFLLKTDSTVNLHWFSFNSELPDELFDEKLLHDRKKLDDLLNTDVFENKPKDQPTPTDK